MQGFWTLLGKAGEGPGKDFHYDIGEKVSSSYDSKSIWTLYHGKKRVNGDIVSVFVCDAKVSSPDDFQLAKTGHKRLKTLRHPNIIKYLDGFESENLVYMVTEPIVPLSSYLDEEDGRNSNLITWGLYQVVNGLNFLVNSGGLLHENVNIFSVFVGLDGEWKLGGVEYVHAAETTVAGKLPCLCRYDPPEGNNSTKRERWSTDAWGLGCLIWEVYNSSLQKAAELKSVSKIPKSLMLHYCDLVHANPRKRTNPKDFLERCLQPGQFFDNEFVKANLFLSEIQIKDANQQKEFFVSLDKSLDTFPKQFCVYKVLPQLLNAFEFGAVGTAVLSPLFKVGLLLDDVAYQAKIVPCIIKLFSSNDRATRIQLLQQMEKFVKHLQPGVVDNQIFACVATGFGDTLPAMREQTVKAMLLLAPKLSPKTINNQLLRFFAKLQMDEQPGIRTNTTICLGKIAEYIPEETRQKVLAPGFIRAIRDPFPHARNAGIMAMAATQKYYSSNDIATRLMPALCACTIDQEKSVRDSAFKVIKAFVSLLETYSDDPDNAVNADATKQEEQGSTWTGWAVSSFTSRFYQNAPNSNAPKSTPDENAPSSGTALSERPSQNTNLSTPKEDADALSDNSNYDDAFGDEYWDEKRTADAQAGDNYSDNGLNMVKKELVEIQDSLKQVPAKTNCTDEKSDHDSDSDYGDWGAEGDWGKDNEWGSFDAPKDKKTSSKPKKASVPDGFGWGDDDWESFDAPASKSLKTTSKTSSRLMEEPKTHAERPVIDKFAVQPFSDAPRTASSLFESSAPKSDFDSFAPIENNEQNKVVSGNPSFTPENNSAVSNRGLNSNANEWANDDWNANDGWDDEGKTKEADAKEKRKQELLRKREEKKHQREIAAKERKAKSSGAMKLGAVKKAPKGDG